MSENAFKVPSIRDLPIVLQRQCVICDEIITERFSSQKDYVDAMAYNSAYVCKECKDAVKAMKRVKVVYRDEGNNEILLECLPQWTDEEKTNFMTPDDLAD